MDKKKAIALFASAAACLLLAEVVKKEEEKQRKTKKRKLWMKEHRINRLPEKKINTNLVKELQLTKPKDYINHLKMDEFSFQKLLSIIRNDIQKQDTLMRNAISAEDRLIITLSFLTTGASFSELDISSTFSSGFISKAINDTCEAIYEHLKKQYLKFPNSKNAWKKIANDYNDKWQFPHCLGVLNTKHVSFSPAKPDSPIYYNKYGYYSIILLALVDADYKFTYIEAGCNGSMNDTATLTTSDLMKILEQPDRYFPDAEIIGNNKMLPYVIAADEKFPFMDNIMIPYTNCTKEHARITFNNRLNRANECIENALWILENRFHILQKRISLKQNKVKTIMLCCCVLHNFLLANSQMYVESANNELIPTKITRKMLHDVESEGEWPKKSEGVRKSFAEYFTAEETYKQLTL